MKLTSLILLSLNFLITPIISTSVMLPLYLYPTSSSSWQPVFSTVAKYTGVTFYIIVNVNSGPGTTACPPSDYSANITQLNTYSNVYTLGYIATNYTNKPITTVRSQIDQYANWTYNCNPQSNGKYNISMAGIFFDEATDSSSTAALNYMKNISTYAYNQIPSDITPVVFNPGLNSTTRTYFNYADFLVEYEGSYAGYKNLTTINNIASQYRPQSALIIYNTTTSSNIASYVHTMIANKIGATYFTPDATYGNLSLLSTVAAAIAAG